MSSHYCYQFFVTRIIIILILKAMNLRLREGK